MIFQPEPLSLNDNVDFEISNFQDYDNALDALNIVKPDCVIITNSLDPTQYSLSLACNFLNIPLICIYYGGTSVYKYSLTEMIKINLKRFLSDKVPSDNIQSKKFRRMKFFISKYNFLLNTKNRIVLQIHIL